MIKRNGIIKYYVLIAVVLSIIGIYFISLMESAKKEIAPKVAYKYSLNVNVEQISFERNGLFLNEIIYNAGGISGYSRVFTPDGKQIKLYKIEPPFIMEKVKDNDTLKIIKGNIVNYLLVRQEQEFSKK